MTSTNQDNTRELSFSEQIHHHFKMFKPYGCVSQFRPKPRKNKNLLGDFYDFPEDTMAIGRLDLDSEGLLLLTSDGMCSYKVRDKSVEKEYYVQVDGIVTDEVISKMQTGVEITVKGDTYMTLPCKARKIEGEPPLPARSRNILLLVKEKIDKLER